VLNCQNLKVFMLVFYKSTRRYDSENQHRHLYLPSSPHGVTTQKTNIDTCIYLQVHTALQPRRPTSTLVSTCKSTRRYNPEDQHRHLFLPASPHGVTTQKTNIDTCIYLQVHTALQPRRPTSTLVSTYKSTRRYNPEDQHRHLYVPTSPHVVTTQKTNIDIFTAVRTSNLTKSQNFASSSCFKLVFKK
jgi:hypothetical protein